MIDSNPPLLPSYGALSAKFPAAEEYNDPQSGVIMEECQLPLIDLNGLNSGNEMERVACATAICRASSEWGFFQVVNHGISPELLRNMRREQVKLFQTPFHKKATCGLLNNSYRWGSEKATCPKQFSWSEAFHIPLTKISEESCYGEFTSLREVMMEVAEAMSRLAKLLAGVLVENLGHPVRGFEDICHESNCFLRLNRYPPCSVSPEIFGLVPHTDSDFLTILYQDEVGGLQLMKDSKWVAVTPQKGWACLLSIDNTNSPSTCSTAGWTSRHFDTSSLSAASTAPETIKTCSSERVGVKLLHILKKLLG